MLLLYCCGEVSTYLSGDLSRWQGDGMVRSDARENRARILAAAREAFLEDGDTSMNQIAQRAGVGPGTLYRNYPNREVLILDIYQDEIDRRAAAVTALLDAQPPLEALRLWTVELVESM